MLPRTTQQSYSAALGRESQIEPWLAICQPAACRREARTEPRNTHDDPNPDPRSGTLAAAEGLDVRKKPSSKKEGEVFFLDIPFYRTRRSLMGTAGAMTSS